MRFKLIIDKDEEEQVIMTVHEPSALSKKIKELVTHDVGSDRIAGYAEDEIHLLNFDQIECITVIAGKTYAIDHQAKQYLLKQRLYEIEQLLPSYFIRINKSTLANELCLSRFKASFSGSIDAIFQCGYKDYVSRRCYAQLKRRFDLK